MNEGLYTHNNMQKYSLKCFLCRINLMKNIAQDKLNEKHSSSSNLP